MSMALATAATVLALMLAPLISARGPQEGIADSAPVEQGEEEAPQVAVDPCDLDAEGNFIDWINRTVSEGVCSSSRWFDSFFGTPREFEDSYTTFGRLGLGALWDEDDGVDPRFRFRARINLPKVGRRWDAVLGRVPVEGAPDEEQGSDPAEQFFDEDEEWLAGFRFTARRSSRANLSLNAGASFSGGVDPYVALRYIYQTPFGERSQFRLRIAPQWQNSKGLGYTFRPSLDHALSDALLLRWGGFIKDFQERFEGYGYGAFANLFHQIGPRDALRYRMGIKSESELEHQPQDVLGSVSWRTMIYKEILIIESLVGTSYRRRPGEDRREPELILGLLFELRFGK